MRYIYLITALLYSQLCFAQQVQWASKVINYSTQQRGDSYSANQVLGEPNSMPSKGYSATAWAAATDDRKEFLQVGFDKPMKIRQVIIAENNAPGAVFKVVVYDTQNIEHEIYHQPAEEVNARSRFFQVKVDETTYEVNAVKISLDCRIVPGINQIDAIGIADNQEALTTEMDVAEMKLFSDPERLSNNVNSSYQEIGPIISPDGKTLFFCRKNFPPNTDHDKIWYSGVDEFSDWQKAVFMPAPLNNIHHNAVESITPDGNTILLANQYFTDPAAYGAGWSISHKTADGWSFPENSKIKNFSNADHYFNCTMSNSGKVILMNVRRSDTRGESDLYASFLQPDESWSEPINLGPQVNSMGRECCAFLASDEKTLYFSSDGYNGYGSNDIYMSKRLDTTWQHWTKPANIGEPINTPDWDAYYSVPAKGDYAYYVRGSDIYRVQIAKEVRPDPVVLVYGTVYDRKTNTPVPNAAIHYENLRDGKEAGVAHSNATNGGYKIVLPYGNMFGFSASAKGYVAVSDNLDVTMLKEYKEIRRDLYLVPNEAGQVIRMNNIFFDSGRAILKEASYPELDRVVKMMKENPTMTIEVVGHSDNVGGDEENLRLSKDRAASVTRYISDHGIEKSRLSSNGFGKSLPIAGNETDEGRAQNRRVEFRIIKS